MAARKARSGKPVSGSVYACVAGILVASMVATARVAAQDRRPVSEDLECRRCEVALTPVARLTGAAVEGEPLAMVRLHDGHLLASYYPAGDVIWEFTPDGSTSRKFAGTGQGPGEVSNVTRIQPFGTDSVIVFEAGNGRASVFSVDGAFGRTFRVPGRVHDSALLSDRSVAINGEISTPELSGVPIQVVTLDGEITHSFGSVEGGQTRPDMPQLAHRRLASDGRGRLWSAMPTSYEVSEWGPAGERRVVWVRNADWFPAYFDDRVVDPSKPFQPWLADMAYVDDGRLAVVSQVGAAGWQDHLGEPYPLKSGRVVYPNWSLSRVHDSIIEIIDMSSGQLYATGRFQGYIVGFLDADHVAFYGETEAGEPVIQVSRVSVRQR